MTSHDMQKMQTGVSSWYLYVHIYTRVYYIIYLSRDLSIFIQRNLNRRPPISLTYHRESYGEPEFHGG